MAKCRVCGREMLTADGCSVGNIHIGKGIFKRIRYGKDEDNGGYRFADSGRRCPDCGAKPGNIHHWGCDIETCPKCGQQLLSCLCEDVRLEV